MANKIQFRRGLKANLPILSVGEPAFTTDTNEFFIGNGTTNTQIGGSQTPNATSVTYDGSNTNLGSNVQSSIDSLNTKELETTGYGVLFNSGLLVTAQSTPNMTVSVSTGTAYMPSGKRYTPTANTSLAINTANSTNPRKDIVYVNSSGVISYLAGTAASSPIAPSLPSGGILLAEIYVAANDTAINTADITDKRAIIKSNTDLLGSINDITVQTNSNTTDLQTISKYPVLSNEVGVVNTTYPYGNVKRFGAKGDGATDDVTAIKNALLSSKEVIFPNDIKLNSLGYAEYICSDKIVLTSQQSIRSNSQIIGGDVMIKFTGTTAATKGVFLNGKQINVSNIRLYSANNVGDALTLGEETLNASNTMCKISDVYTYNFNNAITNTAVAWVTKISNMRINDPNYGIKIINTGGTNFNFMFENIYVDHAKVCCLNGAALCGPMINCNFSINNLQDIVLGTGCNIDFIGCNIEADTHITGSGNIMSLNSQSFSFSDCIFTSDAEAGVCWFGTDVGLTSLTFKNIIWKKRASDLSVEAFDKNSANTNVYGAIKILSGCSEMIRPNFYSGQLSNWIDIENGKPITFTGTTITKSKLSTGTLLFQSSSNKMCYYNGTNVVDMSGTTIV